MMDEAEFNKKYPTAARLPVMDSLTVKAYITDNYIWLFDRFDGHLAFQYDRSTNKTIYECDCIKIGRKLIEG